MLCKPLYKLSILFAIVLFTFSCAKSESVDLIVDKPELLKKEKMATFYGPESKQMCETYRKVYAGFCDTINQPFVKCYDINDKKYKLTTCE